KSHLSVTGRGSAADTSRDHEALCGDESCATDETQGSCQPIIRAGEQAYQQDRLEVDDVIENSMLRMTRQPFTQMAGGAVAALALGEACVTSSGAGDEGRLTARPIGGRTSSLKSGPLGLGTGRDGLIQLPSSMLSGKVPLLLYLHGAT